MTDANKTMDEAAKETDKTEERAKEEEDTKAVKQLDPEQVLVEQQESKPEVYVPIDIRL